MLRRAKAVAPKADPVALSVPDKIKLLASDSLAMYPSGLTQPFSRQELTRLKKRFATLLPADSPSLLLPISVFLLMPELRLYPFVPLVTACVAGKSAESSDDKDNERENVISYAQFLTILAIFSGKQSLESKRRVLFDVYDADADGSVSVDDFVLVLAKILHESPFKLRPTVEAKLAPFFNSARESFLRFDTFRQFVSDEEVWTALTIPF